MNLYESAWKSIILPPQYPIRKSSYGPKQKMVNGHKIIRTDLEVINRNNKKLSGFIFTSDFEPVETLLYLHGNGGSKIEVLPLVQHMVQFKINVAAFDFAGCGNSDPEYLTYGLTEIYDIRDMLQQIRKNRQIGRVTLWGRSMGALCCIMFADMYSYQINNIILDSPFKSLGGTINRIANRQVYLPNCLIKLFMHFVKQRAIKQTNHNIFEVNYLKIFSRINSRIPILFIYSHFDAIVPAQEVFQFYNTYQGQKDLCEIYQTHDEDRPQTMWKQCLMWITKTKKKNFNGLVQARHFKQTIKQQDQNHSESTYC